MGSMIIVSNVKPTVGRTIVPGSTLDVTMRVRLSGLTKQVSNPDITATYKLTNFNGDEYISGSPISGVTIHSSSDGSHDRQLAVVSLQVNLPDDLPADQAGTMYFIELELNIRNEDQVWTQTEEVTVFATKSLVKTLEDFVAIEGYKIKLKGVLNYPEIKTTIGTPFISQLTAGALTPNPQGFLINPNDQIAIAAFDAVGEGIADIAPNSGQTLPETMTESIINSFGWTLVDGASGYYIYYYCAVMKKWKRIKTILADDVTEQPATFGTVMIEMVRGDQLPEINPKTTSVVTRDVKLKFHAPYDDSTKDDETEELVIPDQTLDRTKVTANGNDFWTYESELDLDDNTYYKIMVQGAKKITVTNPLFSTTLPQGSPYSGRYVDTKKLPDSLSGLEGDALKTAFDKQTTLGTFYTSYEKIEHKPSMEPISVQWSYVEDNEYIGSSEVWRVTVEVDKTIREMEQMLNRGFNFTGISSAFTNADYMKFLLMGRDFFNSLARATDFTFERAEGPLRHNWLICSLHQAAISRAMEEAIKSFEFGALGTSLEINLVQAYETFQSQMNEQVETNVKEFKLQITHEGLFGGDGSRKNYESRGLVMAQGKWTSRLGLANARNRYYR